MGVVQSVFSCAGACWRMEIPIFYLPATACCCLAITVDKCSDWLQHCLINIYAKVILFHFQTWFHVKIKFFKTILFHFRRGSMLK